MRIFLSLMLSGLFLVGCSKPAGFVDAAAPPEESGKPKLLIFTASWCPPCKMMKSDVYPSPVVKEVADRFDWKFIDVDDQKNQEMVTAYRVRSIPMIVLQKPDGVQIDRMIGGTSPADFRKFLNKAL